VRVPAEAVASEKAHLDGRGSERNCRHWFHRPRRLIAGLGCKLVAGDARIRKDLHRYDIVFALAALFPIAGCTLWTWLSRARPRESLGVQSFTGGISMRQLILLSAFAASSAMATAVLSFNTSGASSGGEYDQSVGWEFTVNSTITVTGLGWYDQNGDGLQMAHEVGIWNSTGTLLTSGTVAAGTTDPLDGLFRTVSISSIVLTPGTYIVGGENFSTNTEQLAFGVTPTTISSISFVGGEFSAADGIFEEPTNLTGNSNCCWGPSFSVSAVPEPGAVALCGFGLLMLGVVAYRRTPPPSHVGQAGRALAR